MIHTNNELYKKIMLQKIFAVCFLFMVSMLYHSCIKNDSSGKNDFDIVILNGRVIDPESDFDAIRNIGISNGSVRLITEKEISGRSYINGQGLVVAPGFIDMHQHGQDHENYSYKVMDGVTTALELEMGTARRRWLVPGKRGQGSYKSWE